MHPDWAHATLKVWGQWVAAGRPLHLSLYGDSISADPGRPRDSNAYRDGRPLWRDGSTDWLIALDRRISGRLGPAGRRILLAAVVPLGRPCHISERAAAAGVDVAEMRAVRRQAMQLIE